MTAIDTLTPVDDLLGAAPHRRARRWLSILFLIAAILGATTFFVRFVTGDDSPYYSAAIERGDLTPRISEHATLRSSGEAVLAASATGKVIWLAPLDGRPMARGTIVARLDTAREMQGAEIAGASLQAAEAAVAAAEITKSDAANRLSRFENVWRRSGGRAPSLNEMEAARTEASRTELALQSAIAERKASAGTLAESRSRLASTEIRTPYDAILVRSEAVPGQVVRRGQPLLTIARTGTPLIAEITAPARIATILSKGWPARVRPDAAPETSVAARLESRAPVTDGQGSSLISFRVAERNAHIRTGAPVIVEVALQARHKVLLVPNAALAFSPQSPTSAAAPNVYVLTSKNPPRKVPVTVGASDGSRTEVFAPELAPGDLVAIGWRTRSGK